MTVQTWEDILYNYVNQNVNPPQNLMAFNRHQELLFNNAQRRAIGLISNPTDQVPQRVTDNHPYPRVDIIPPEQVHTFRDLGPDFDRSHQVVASALIIGPPGTGKTHVICSGSILRILSAENLERGRPKRVFIATFSNAGAYRVYEKFHEIASACSALEFYERIKLVQSRLARERYAFENLTRRLNLGPDDFTIDNRVDDRDLLNHTLIYIGTTDSLSILSNNNPSPRVHGVIYDEASQLTVPQFFQVIPNQTIESVCVVGDDAQLPPVSTLVPLGVSALSYLQGINAYQNSPIPGSRRIELRRQYRMHPTIAQLTQRLVRSRRVVIPDGATIQPDYLLPSVNYNLSNLPPSLNQASINLLGNILRPEHPLVIIDTSKIPQAIDERAGKSRRNPIEAQIAISIHNALKLAYSTLTDEEIILTSPYRQQVDIFQNLRVRTGTVHQYQGQEAPVVIYSLTFASQGTKSDFFSQLELMYVGLSRAQRKLIILGNKDAMDHPDRSIQAIRSAIFDFQYVNRGQGYPNYTPDPVCHLKEDVDGQFLIDINNNLL